MWGQNNQNQNQNRFGGGFGQNTNTTFGQPAQQNPTFTFGANNQQQQQQQPQTGFGGTNTGFTFGANNQQQQPTNTFGQPAQPTSVFGANTQNQTQNNAFGARPGFGAAGSSTLSFGSNSTAPTTTFGAQPAFGSNTASTFGKPASTFGAAPTQFGAMSSGSHVNPAEIKAMFPEPSRDGESFVNLGSTVYEQHRPYYYKFSLPGTNDGNTLDKGTRQLDYQPTWLNDEEAPFATDHPRYKTPEQRQKERDVLKQKDQFKGVNLYHHISMMFPYQDLSNEEMRFLDRQHGQAPTQTYTPPGMAGIKPPQHSYTLVSTTQRPGDTLHVQLTEDYQKNLGRGYVPIGGQAAPAAGAGGLFGSSGTTGFGGGTTGFGAAPTSTFGQPANPTPGFGQPQQPQTNVFGAQTNNTSTNLFGQPQQNQQQNQGGGLFGGGAFGANQQQQQPQQASTFGAFGAKPATTFGTGSTGGFGQTNTATTGGFGQPAPANPSTFSFGATQPAQNQQSGGTGFGGFGGFGANQQNQQQQQQQQPAQATFGFGANTQQQNQTQNQNQPSTGLFGSANKPATTFGAFGSTPAPAPASTGFGFGQTQPAQTTQPANTGFSFGSQPAQPAQPAAGTSLFGNNTQQPQQPAQGTSLFGSTNTNTNTNNTGGGLFGGGFGAKPAAPATGGFGFGATSTQQPQQNQQPAQTSLFGGANTNTGSLFGSTQNNAPKPATTFGGFGTTSTNTGSGGTGLFGGLGQTQPPAGQNTLFGSQPPANNTFGFNSTSQPAQNNNTGGMFNSTLGQSTQQPLTASVDQNAYGSNPLFTYSGQPLEISLQGKRPALPPLTSSNFRLTPKRGQVDKLRGFSSPSLSRASPGSPLSGLTVPNRTSSPIAADRYKGLSDTILTPTAFVPRPSIKRLNVTPKSLSSSDSHDHLESVLGKSALRSPAASPAQSREQRPRYEPPQSPSHLFSPVSNGNGFNASASRTNGSPAQTPASPSVSAQEPAPKQGDYWCKPRLEKLRQMSKYDLQEVSNFTAGRVGCGEVVFLEPVDLTSVDLDTFLGTVIVFTDMELAVYPDDGPDKPARGAGLNVPAKIMLENVFTKDKATKQNITDTSDPRHVKFIKRVKSIPDTEFVSYTDDGVWTFTVEHFSRYGLRDEEESEEEETGVMRLKRALVRKEVEFEGEEAPVKSVHERDDDVSEYNDETERSGSGSESGSESGHSEKDQSMAESIDGGSDKENWAEPIKTKVGVQGWEKVKSMRAGQFVPVVSVDLDVGALKRKTGRSGVVSSLKRSVAQRDREPDFRFAEEERNAQDTRVVRRASFGETASPPLLRQPRKFARVELGKSLVGGVGRDEGVRADAGLALGRSFRCSWGPNGELVHFGRIAGVGAEPATGSDATVYVQKVQILAGDDQAERTKAYRLLQLHLERSVVELDEGVPVAAIDASIRFRDFAARFDAGDRSHEANVFRLGVALFDEIDLRLPVDSPPDLVMRIAEVRRKLALSAWLQDAVSPSVDAELVKTNLRPAKVFTMLSGNQIERAVHSAIEGNDLRLATLLAQVGGPDVFRDEMRRQLDDWAKYKANPLISVEYRRIYALLAGITDVSVGDSSRGIDGCVDVVVSAGLDWKRALGVRMWFADHFEDDVSTILESFASSLDSAHPPARPVPAYLESAGSTDNRQWRTPTEPSDILYGLIRLYADNTIPLEGVLHSRDASPSPMDVRVLWHLYLLLSRVLQKRDFGDRDDAYSAMADGLSQGYAAQLEGVGDWVGAVFVLLHLETREGRRQAVCELLSRHPNPTDEERVHLTDTLKIPVEWIHMATAAERALAGDVYGEYQELVRARLYDRAHKVLVGRLLHEVVLRDDLGLIRTLCGLVAGKAKEWEYGAKLFIDYADIREQLTPLLSSVLRPLPGSTEVERTRDNARVRELSRSLGRLLQLLPALFPERDDLQGVAALADMLSHLHGLSGVLCGAGYISRPAVSHSLVDVDRLHLLQDTAYDAFSRNLETCVMGA